MFEADAHQEARLSAQNFRAVLKAVSRPGSAQELSNFGSAPYPLLGPTAAVAVTLCDYQSPIWLSPSLDTNEVQRFLRFETGAPLVPDRASSLFAFMTIEEACAGLEGFAFGSHEYPDRSTTLVIQCERFDSGFEVELSGPGLKAAHICSVAGATAGLWQDLWRNHQRFPLGFDVLFVTAGQVMGLPRSTRITLPGDA